MINPGEIPQIPGDIEAVARHGGTLQTEGKSFGSTGSDVHSTWQGLSAFYSAPEAAELFAATGPVKQKTEAVGSDIAAVGAALVTYADEVRPIKTRLASLQSEAQTFVNSVNGDHDWRKDGAKVNHNNQLLSDVNGQISAWMAAQRKCANAIDRLFGGIQYVEDNGDGTRNRNEFGYSSELLNQAAAGDDGVPWGKPAERDKPWYQDVGDAIVSFGKGVVVDGLWGTIKGLGNLAGFGGWDGLKQSWGGLFKLGLIVLAPELLIVNQFTALPGLPKGTLVNTVKDTGKALLAWDQWKHDPARAAGNVVFNVASVVFGTKGAGATTKGLSTAAKGTRAAELAARVSVKVSEVIATIKSKLPTLKLPDFLTPKTTAYALDEDFIKSLPDHPGTPHLPDGKPPGLTRLDHDFGSPINEMGVPKTHLDAHGDLQPANPAGATQPYQHVLGNLDRAAKADSPYSSWSVTGHDAKIFGGRQQLHLDVDRLQADIAAGRVTGVEVLPPSRVQASIQGAIDQVAKRHIEVTLRADATPSAVQDFVSHLGLSKTAAKRLLPRIQAMLNCQRDLEWLIRGTIPHGYLHGPFPGPMG